MRRTNVLFWSLLAAMASFIGQGTAASAATITWGTATNTTAATDISTTGTVVQALNYGPTSTGTITVNGVTFDNDDGIFID